MGLSHTLPSDWWDTVRVLQIEFCRKIANSFCNNSRKVKLINKAGTYIMSRSVLGTVTSQCRWEYVAVDTTYVRTTPIAASSKGMHLIADPSPLTGGLHPRPESEAYQKMYIHFLVVVSINASFP